MGNNVFSAIPQEVDDFVNPLPLSRCGTEHWPAHMVRPLSELFSGDLLALVPSRPSSLKSMFCRTASSLSLEALDSEPADSAPYSAVNFATLFERCSRAFLALGQQTPFKLRRTMCRTESSLPLAAAESKPANNAPVAVAAPSTPSSPIPPAAAAAPDNAHAEVVTSDSHGLAAGLILTRLRAAEGANEAAGAGEASLAPRPAAANRTASRRSSAMRLYGDLPPPFQAWAVQADEVLVACYDDPPATAPSPAAAAAAAALQLPATPEVGGDCVVSLAVAPHAAVAGARKARRRGPTRDGSAYGALSFFGIGKSPADGKAAAAAAVQPLAPAVRHARKLSLSDILRNVSSALGIAKAEPRGGRLIPAGPTCARVDSIDVHMFEAPDLDAST